MKTNKKGNLTTFFLKLLQKITINEKEMKTGNHR